MESGHLDIWDPGIQDPGYIESGHLDLRMARSNTHPLDYSTIARTSRNIHQYQHPKGDDMRSGPWDRAAWEVRTLDRGMRSGMVRIHPRRDRILDMRCLDTEDTGYR
jgi:hypothetical protein